MVGDGGRGGGSGSGSGTHNDVMYLLYADRGDQTTAMLCSNCAWRIRAIQTCGTGAQLRFSSSSAHTPYLSSAVAISSASTFRSMRRTLRTRPDFSLHCSMDRNEMR